MKKYILTILFSFFALALAVNPSAFAASPSPTDAALQQQIDQLQQQIASKVAEMNLVEKRGIVGTVTNVTDTQITLSDLKGNTRFVDVDELTKFYSSSSSTFGMSDIKNGLLLGILGLYNKQSQRILARDVTYMTPFPSVIYGAVAFIDRNNYEITILTPQQKKEIIEIQDVTKTFSYSSNSLVRSGFSKVSQAETIMAIGFPDIQSSNKLIGTNILLFPDIQLGYASNLQPNLNPTIPPSTGSGVKLYPLSK